MIRAIACLFLLSACAVPVDPPEALLECMPAPTVPAGEYTQTDVAGFVLDLSEAHADCEGKLGAVREYLAVE